MAQAQRRCFARDNEIGAESSEGAPNEGGVGMLIPYSLTNSHEYWHPIATKWFPLSLQPGRPTMFLAFTMNRYLAEYQAITRGSGIFADSAIRPIVFKAKLSGLMKFIIHYEILGRVSAFTWRIDHQKRGLPRTYVPFWTDCDNQNIPRSNG
jgi:hypothetical protein